MPDPVLFVQAVATSGAVSAIVVAVIILLWRPAGAVRINAACILGILLGAAAGFRVMQVVPHWPPMDGLDRFLYIVVPWAAAIELIAGFTRVPRLLAWGLRIALAAVAGRILLHGSSYLDGSSSDWASGQIWVAMCAGALLLTFVWVLLGWLAQRSGGISIPLAVSQSGVAAGMTLMLSGYLTGGKAALPLAAGLAAAVIAVRVVDAIGRRWRVAGDGKLAGDHGAGAIGIGVVSLFSILVLGRYFGELSTGRAVAVLLAPLLCWSTELPVLRNRKPWQVAATRLALVALPLAAVLFMAERDFARNSAMPSEGESGNFQY